MSIEMLAAQLRPAILWILFHPSTRTIIGGLLVWVGISGQVSREGDYDHNVFWDSKGSWLPGLLPGLVILASVARSVRL